MGHDHGHVSAAHAHRGRLAVVLVLTLAVMVLEVIVGLLSGSLALLADAAHMASDAGGVALALGAVAVGARGGGPGSRRSFGNHRTEVLAAAVNGTVLLAIGVWVVVGALGRLGDPPDVDAPLVLAAGGLGLVVNVVGLLVLRAGAQDSLNVRGAYLEVLGDALGSVAVVGSAVVVLTTGWALADPLASLLIAALVVPRALSLLRDVVEVLLESTPRDVDLAELRDHIVETPGVRDVHDLHVWTITSGMPVMSAHVVVDEAVRDLDDAHGVLDRLRACLADHFDVEHSTFQIEPHGHLGSEPHVHH